MSFENLGLYSQNCKAVILFIAQFHVLCFSEASANKFYKQIFTEGVYEENLYLLLYTNEIWPQSLSNTLKRSR